MRWLPSVPVMHRKCRKPDACLISTQNRARSVRRTQHKHGSVSRESQPSLFEFVDVVAEFQRRPQLQPQIFHHHLAFQQEQSISVNLLKGSTRAWNQQNTNLSHNHANNRTPKTIKQSALIKLPLISTFSTYVKVVWKVCGWDWKDQSNFKY